MLLFRYEAWYTLNCLDLADSYDWHISLTHSATASDVSVSLHHLSIRAIPATIYRLCFFTAERHSRQAKLFINDV